MRKKRQPHRKFIITTCEEDNQLSCEEAVRIAVEHFGTGEYVEAEKGIWILWDSSGRAWAFQKKGMGFSMDTPYITYEDVAQSCGLVRKFWESGMQREIELIPGPFDPKDGYGDIYHYNRLRIQYMTSQTGATLPAMVATINATLWPWLHPKNETMQP